MIFGRVKTHSSPQGMDLTRTKTKDTVECPGKYQEIEGRGVQITGLMGDSIPH